MVWKHKKVPEQALFDMFQALKIEPYKKVILQERYLKVLDNFRRRARTLAYAYYICRIFITVGSILVPAFLSIQRSTSQLELYWTTWVISLSVTISNGLVTLFKVDKKYFFINTTLEMLQSEGWQYAGLSGRYAPKEDPLIPLPTHENQFLIFFHMSEKIKMRQVEEEFWKFTDSAGVGNATGDSMVSKTPETRLAPMSSLPPDRKGILQSWAGDLNQNVLGLQPRTNKSGAPVDGRRNSTVSGPSSKASMSVRSPMPTTPSIRDAMVPETPGLSTIPEGAEGTKIPENTIVQVPGEPALWV